jgi:transposase
LTDKNGYIFATTDVIAGNHNDVYHVTKTLHKLFSDMKRCMLSYKGAFFNADKAFDTRIARKMLWNRGVIPNIAENTRNRTSTKRGRKRHFNEHVHKDRFAIERTFAWIDKFRTLLTRFERKDVYWLGFHYLAFTLINLRNLLAKV